MTATEPQSQTLRFAVIEEANNEIREFLAQQLREHNNQVSEHHRRVRVDGFDPLHIVVRHEDDKIVAGLTGSTYWHWLEVDKLWVAESWREQGIGRQLLRQAESIAQERGCVRAMLTTYSFQAREFYEKEGYSVVGVLEDYPPGNAYLWLRKDFEDDKVKG